jgi:L-alanine-DL-glutamate epimerase-like enolase superfamily enzyme
LWWRVGQQGRHVAPGLVDYLIIKINRSGGIWPSLQQIGVALAARQGLVLSGLCETLLMRAAGAQVAAAFGLHGPAALNGGQFLDETHLYPKKQLTERDGRIHLDDQPGIGVEPDFHAVEELLVRSDA